MVMELEQIATGFVGAVVALLLQGAWHRWRDAKTAKALATALWEELSAVAFNSVSGSPLVVEIAGFSSQTFDTLFPLIAQTLPEDLSRDLMRYHWRMKFLVKKAAPLRGRVHTSEVDEWMKLRDNLLRGLDDLQKRWTLRLALWREERNSTKRLRKVK